MPDNLSPNQQDALRRLAQAVEQEMNLLKERENSETVTEADSKSSESGNGSELSQNALDNLLWSTLETFQNYSFFTAKKLEFSYILKGYEMFVSRKDKSITKSTVILSFHKALAVQLRDGRVAGPKKLGTFGASYLYPIFLFLGIITD